MATRPRPSSTIPKAPISLSPSCNISDLASLTGTQLITLSANAVLHPRAKLVTSFAPIVVGEGCVICEKASVGMLSAADDPAPEDGVTLERDVVVEAGAVVEAASVDRGSLIEAGARVGRGARVGKVFGIQAHQGASERLEAKQWQYCRIGPLCLVAPGEVMPDHTILYGHNQRRSERPGLEDLRARAHEKHIQTLKKLIPVNPAKWQ